MKPNWQNRTLWTGDNLDILRGMNSDCIDLIYLDPPFNSNRTYSAPIGSEAAGAAFKDSWTLDDVDLAWHGEIAEREPALYGVIDAAGLAHSKSMKSYLIMMGVRLIELRRVLKDSGSIYLHCDSTASHYLKMLMDTVFGKDCFKNDLVWRYGGSARGAKAVAKHFARNNDSILLYAKDRKRATHNSVHGFKQYPADNLPSHIRRDGEGRYFKTAPRGDYTDASVERLRAEGRIHITRTGNIRVKYFLERRGDVVLEPTLVGSVWDIPDMMHSRKERTGYPTQKPLALLDRIIKASSNEGDLVLDPFCGCATACVAAERLRRQWVGIDLSPKAAQLVRQRLKQEMGIFYDIAHREDIPKRTDLGKLPSYRTHKHSLYGRQEGFCAGCRAHFPFRNLTVDHIVPLARGGSDHIDNLQLLCGACNSTKGQGSQAQLMVRLREQGVVWTP